MAEYLSVFLKGLVIGAANIVPGVSGGTIAFITGIYERTINCLRNCDSVTLKLLLVGKFQAALERIDYKFMLSLGIGAVVAILSLAKLVKFLFFEHWILILAFFFGLIAFSAISMAKLIKKHSLSNFILLIFGCAIAITTCFMKPAAENTSFLYLALCGAVAMCSMIIPGISGSFVMLLLGNYILVMEAIAEQNIKILIPIFIGAIVGALLLARLLNWIFKNYHDQAVSLLTGFVIGSLLLIWPWKIEIPLRDDSGKLLVKSRIEDKRVLKSYQVENKDIIKIAGKIKSVKINENQNLSIGSKNKIILRKYEWFLPSFKNTEHKLTFAILIAIIGAYLAHFVERWAKN